MTELINGVNVNMKINNGASTSVINENTFHNLSQSVKVLKLIAVNILHAYTGKVIPVVGEC